MTESASSKIRVLTYDIDLQLASLPPCLLQLTLLEAQTMIWVGQAGSSANLARDWSVAMPGNAITNTVIETVCFRVTDAELTTNRPAVCNFIDFELSRQRSFAVYEQKIRWAEALSESLDIYSKAIPSSPIQTAGLFVNRPTLLEYGVTRHR